MKILHVHAHFDDFEFVAAGLFTVWKRKLGDGLRAKVIVCTDGKAGHHFRTREETGRVRLQEQLESARVGGYEFEQLRLPDGSVPREACLPVSIPLLAALWKAVREFEPDYLFCPPVAAEALAGIHNDHVTIAEAVRRVAYMINVPHAFTPEYPVDETRSEAKKVPVILNVYDGYMFGSGGHDIAVDVEDVFEDVCAMSWCHQSQIREWLPWVGRHDMEAPATMEQWCEAMRYRMGRRARELGIDDERATEVFTVTAWGEVPANEQILRDIPNIVPGASHLDRLRQRLARWRLP
jgi:LmbE family N-acetylglucosaminyl deacetylase